MEQHVRVLILFWLYVSWHCKCKCTQSIHALTCRCQAQSARFTVDNCCFIYNLKFKFYLTLKKDSWVSSKTLHKSVIAKKMCFNKMSSSDCLEVSSCMVLLFCVLEHFWATLEPFTSWPTNAPMTHTDEYTTRSHGSTRNKLIPVSESKVTEVLKHASLVPSAADILRLLAKSERLVRATSISRDRSIRFDSITNRPK